MAVPYIDLDVIGAVADPGRPYGPLGALGPLPVEHVLSETRFDLSEQTVALKDEQVVELLKELVEKQVAVVVAGTGTGKSTFLPFRLLHPPSGAPLRLADRGPIIVTEPRIMAAQNTALWVAKSFAGTHVGAGSEIGFRAGGRSSYDTATRLLYVTDGSLINWIRDGRLSSYSAIVIDEAHERNRNIDIALGLLREALPRYRHLRVIVTSATMDPDFFVSYFGGPERVYKLVVSSGRTWGYTVLWPEGKQDASEADWERPGPDNEDLQAATAHYARLVIGGEVNPRRWRDEMPGRVAAQILAILKGTDRGDILAFLPGRATIEQAVAAVRKSRPDVDVFELLSSTPESKRDEACRARGLDEPRRVVIATNIAETSVTLKGIRFVVDSGLIHQSEWDPATASKRMPAVAHSRDGMRQRWGRVGRDAPGWVFPLYTRSQFDAQHAHTAPEACRADLEQFFLKAAASGVEDPTKFHWPLTHAREAEHAEEAPRRDVFARELARASQALRARGAVRKDGSLTPIGREIERLPVEASVAICLVAADRAACAVEVATVLAAFEQLAVVGGILQYRDSWSATRRSHVQERHLALFYGCQDDLDLVLKVVGGWQLAGSDASWGRDTAERRRAFAQHHHLSHAVLKRIDEQAQRLLEPFARARRSNELRPVDSRLAERARNVLAVALPDRIWVRSEATGWRPDGPGNWERSTTLDTRPWMGLHVNRVMAWKCYSARADLVILDFLIVPPATVPKSIAQRDLDDVLIDAMVALADRPGRALSPSLQSHWARTTRSLVGGHLVIERTDDGDGPLCVISAQYPADLGDLDKRDGEPEEGEDEESDGGEVQFGDKPEGQLAIRKQGTLIVFSPEDEEEYLELDDLEPSPDVSAPDHDPVLDDLGNCLSFGNSALPPVGRWHVRVVGISGMGADRRWVVSLVGSRGPGEVLHLAGSEVAMDIEHIGLPWGRSRNRFAVLRCSETGERVIVDAEHASLAPGDYEGLERLTSLGCRLPVTRMLFDDQSKTWEGTLLPALAGAFWDHVGVHGQGTVDATLQEPDVTSRGRLFLAELSVPGRPLLHRLRLSVGVAQVKRLKIRAGAPVWLSDFRVPEVDRRKGTTSPDLIAASSVGVGFDYDEEAKAIRVSSPPLQLARVMPLLGSLRNESDKRSLWNLWRASHQVTVRGVQHGLRPGPTIGVVEAYDLQRNWVKVRLPTGRLLAVPSGELAGQPEARGGDLFAPGDPVMFQVHLDVDRAIRVAPTQTPPDVRSGRLDKDIRAFVTDIDPRGAGIFVTVGAESKFVHISQLTADNRLQASSDELARVFPRFAPVVVRILPHDSRKPERWGLVQLLQADGTVTGGAWAHYEPGSPKDFGDARARATGDWRTMTTWCEAFGVSGDDADLWCSVAGLCGGTGVRSTTTAARLMAYRPAVGPASSLAAALKRLDSVLCAIGSSARTTTPHDMLREVSITMNDPDAVTHWIEKLDFAIRTACGDLDARLQRVDAAEAASRSLLKELEDARAWIEAQEAGIETRIEHIQVLAARFEGDVQALSGVAEELHDAREQLKGATADISALRQFNAFWSKLAGKIDTTLKKATDLATTNSVIQDQAAAASKLLAAASVEATNVAKVQKALAEEFEAAFQKTRGDAAASQAQCNELLSRATDARDAWKAIKAGDLPALRAQQDRFAHDMTVLRKDFEAAISRRKKSFSNRLDEWVARLGLFG